MRSHQCRELATFGRWLVTVNLTSPSVLRQDALSCPISNAGRMAFNHDGCYYVSVREGTRVDIGKAALRFHLHGLQCGLAVFMDHALIQINSTAFVKECYEKKSSHTDMQDVQL